MTTDKALTKIDKVSTLTMDDLAKICEEEGVTARSICRTMSDGMKSCTIGKIDTEGEIIPGTSQPDMPTRHKYMQSAMEVFRLVKKDIVEVKDLTVTHKMSSDDITRLEAIAKELKGLEQRLINDKVQQGVIDV